MAKRDYYGILGVDRKATAAQIKAAYRKMAREYHPDVNKDAGASEKFQEATEAYEVLFDADKRRMYDRFGHAGPGRSGPQGGRAYDTTGARPGGVSFNFEEMFGRSGGSGFAGMGLDEILDALRGGSGRSKSGRRAAAKRGADLEYELTLDFVQAVRGVTTSIRLARQGRTETIDVKVPPGVRDGQQIRVRNQGQDGPAGRGDLYIIARVRKHPYFRREGKDIYVEVPIGIAEAALGGKVDVPTLDGMTAVQIPAGSSSGRKLRLKGRGVRPAKGDAPGDQYVELKIVVPKTLSVRQRELLTELQELDDGDPRRNVPWA